MRYTKHIYELDSMFAILVSLIFHIYQLFEKKLKNLRKFCAEIPSVTDNIKTIAEAG